MKRLTLIILSVFCFSYVAPAQPNHLEIVFTGRDNTDHLGLDMIHIVNKTLDCDTTLYYPDTVLVLINTVGIEEDQRNEGFQLFQNFPNPVIDQASFRVFIPGGGVVNFMITDIFGRQLNVLSKILDQGFHSFRFIPGSEQLYILTAVYQGHRHSIKIISLAQANGRQCMLEYTGSEGHSSVLKSNMASLGFQYDYGNQLQYLGYSDFMQSGMLHTPEDSDTCILQFATNIPCVGIPTVEYEGQVYNTIQIFSQCWLKENLNVGQRIIGGEDQTDNGIIEKYCYDDNESNCDFFGGLYSWNEMMQYTLEESAQGICPAGWHIPSDDEWKILEGSVDGEYGIGHSIWEEGGFRGSEVGNNLKSTDSWVTGGGGLDAFGFNALAAGWCGGISFSYGGLETWSCFWASTRNPLIPTKYWDRLMLDYSDQVVRSTNASGGTGGFSVRCLKD